MNTNFKQKPVEARRVRENTEVSAPISKAETQPKFQQITDELGGLSFRPKISARGVIQ